MVGGGEQTRRVGIGDVEKVQINLLEEASWSCPLRTQAAPPQNQGDPHPQAHRHRSEVEDSSPFGH